MLRAIPPATKAHSQLLYVAHCAFCTSAGLFSSARPKSLLVLPSTNRGPMTSRPQTNQASHPCTPDKFSLFAIPNSLRFLSAAPWRFDELLHTTSAKHRKV